MRRLAVLVVLYGKNISDSTTIATLLNVGLSNAKVVIHNNGPTNLEFPDSEKEKFISQAIQVELINCVDNKPLSSIYNGFIDDHRDFDIFTIFDDDSMVSHDYVTAVDNDSYDIELPKIISRVDGAIYYPISKGVPITENGVIRHKEIFSIGSGLTFTKNVVDAFKKFNICLFDEHYALYGVDFSFFRRMHFLQMKGMSFILSSTFTLYHGLSKTESVQSHFRHRERLIDFALTVRHYPSPRLYLALVKRVLTDSLCLNFKDVNLVLKSYFSSYHPRCKKYSK